MKSSWLCFWLEVPPLSCTASKPNVKLLSYQHWWSSVKFGLIWVQIEIGDVQGNCNISKISIGAGFRLEDLDLEGESGKILFWYDGVSESYDCTIYATYCKLLLFIFQNILKSSESVKNIPRGLKIDFKWAETQIFMSWTFIYKTWPWTAVL